MQTKRILIFTLLMLGELLVTGSSRGAGPVQSAHKFNKQGERPLDYLLYLPPDYERKAGWPLILFLHGAGEAGDDIERVKDDGLPEMLEKGKTLPFIVVSPQCPRGAGWKSKLKVLSALIDEIAANYKVDQDRIYLTGLSMGGFGTWALAADTPDRFAAIIPTCGGGDLGSVEPLKNLPIWAFHGAKDDVVPIEPTRELVEALKKAHGNVKFTVYPELRHDSWTVTYNNPEIYKWLLEHKRAPRAQKEGARPEPGR
jgi:predicted peptidase